MFVLVFTDVSLAHIQGPAHSRCETNICQMNEWVILLSTSLSRSTDSYQGHTILQVSPKCLHNYRKKRFNLQEIIDGKLFPFLIP